METKSKKCAGGLCGKKSAAPTPEDLAVINARYALSPLAEEQVYVRKVFLCHNAVDRDGERFSEPLLDQFAATLPGKALMNSHWHDLEAVLGRFFWAGVEEEPLADATARTGEPLCLPDGVKTVKWVVGKFYIPLIGEEQKSVAAALDSGLLHHVSIGFTAAEMKRVRAEDNPDSILYWEYQGPGEAREGSIVWLGAQPGASVVKAAKDKNITDNRKENQMEKVKKMLGLPPEASEAEVLKAMEARDSAAQAEKSALQAEADVGKAYRESLAKEVADLETRLGRHTSEEAKAARAKSLQGRSVADLEADKAFLVKQVTAQFPSQPKTGSASGESNALDGKSFEDRVEELKGKGLSHYEAVKAAAAKTPGSFLKRLSPGSAAAN